MPDQLKFIPINLPDGTSTDENLARLLWSCDYKKSGELPALGSVCKDIQGCNLGMERGIGDWKLVRKEDGPDGNWFLFFGKPRTTLADLRTPVSSYETTRNYTWPQVLLALGWTEDNAFPITTHAMDAEGNRLEVFAPKFYERIARRPETTIATRCVVKTFLKTEAWPGQWITNTEPQADNVQWDFNGSQGSLNCLHDDLVFPSRGKPYATRAADGTAGSSDAPDQPEREFPATEAIDWEVFVVNTQQPLGMGMWVRTEYTFYPPNIEEQTL